MDNLVVKHSDGHKPYLEHLTNGKELSYEDTRTVFNKFVVGEYATRVVCVAFLTAYCMRRPTGEELRAILSVIKNTSVSMPELRKIVDEVPLPYNVVVHALKLIQEGA